MTFQYLKRFFIYFSLLLFVPFPSFGAANKGSNQQFIISNYDKEMMAREDAAMILSEGEIDETEVVIPESEELALATRPSKNLPPLPGLHIDLKQVFQGSPFIYTLLLSLSMTAITLWLYTTLRWRQLGGYSEPLKKKLKHLLKNKDLKGAYLLCKRNKDLLSRMIYAAINSETKTKHDLEEIMQKEARVATSASWQRISLLNDIALIAPMLGLMGTVLGMFYAFYDLNRSLDTITKLFDGLGISVATTVGGLVVALLALMLHTFCKHRLMRRLVLIEQETETFVTLIEKSKMEQN